jgi:hypothetical protein
MLDRFGSSRQPTSDSMGDRLILCTTDLGLRRSEAKFINSERGTEFVEDVVLTPMVAVQSILDDFAS